MNSGGPKPQVTSAPDPEAERVKKEEGERSKELDRRRYSSRTIATSSQGIPGSAPSLTTKLGGG